MLSLWTRCSTSSFEFGSGVFFLVARILAPTVRVVQTEAVPESGAAGY